MDPHKNDQMVEAVHVDDALKMYGDVQTDQVMSAELANAVENDHLSPWSRTGLKLSWLIIVTGIINCLAGYDSTLMSSVNAMTPFHDHFGTDIDGSGTGLVFSIFAIGGLVGALFGAPASDTFGRRFGIFVGSAFVVMGVIIEITASHINQFIGGRFFIGFGVSISTISGPVYLVEISPPHWRGTFGGLSHVLGYYLGALACTWSAYGTGFLKSNWSWKIPTLIQLIPSGIVMISVLFMPESPRWLYANGHAAKGKQVLIKYHGSGNPDSALAKFQDGQILEDLERETETGMKKWWDYSILFSTRGMLYRTWLLMLTQVFSSFIGGAVISYYMPVILENIGITDSHKQLLMNAINVILSMLSGIVGSFFVDRWGRRNLFLWGTILTGLTYVPINVIASFNKADISTGEGYAFIACIFLYGIFFSFTWTPLQNLYPAEILPNSSRGKGMAFAGLTSSAANFINLYATPIALKNIGWKTYTIFLVLHFVEVVLMYFTLVETKDRSIEELNYIFDSPDPVKTSLQKQTVIVRPGEGVLPVDDA